MKNRLFLLRVSLFAILLMSIFSTASTSAETRRCALESCHGLNLKCGFNPPDMCTQLYAIGDFCRLYAACELKGDSCSLTKNPLLDKCIACVDACPKKDPGAHSDCESKCRTKIEKAGK